MTGTAKHRPWHLLVLPGDGIGPEVIGASRPVMEVASWVLESRHGRGLYVEEALIGGAAVDAYGTPLPPETLDRARAADAVLLGAVGGPQWDGRPPQERPEAGLLGLRRGLGVFANLRPAWALPGEPKSPLQPALVPGVNILVVRELAGGLYYGEPRRTFRAADGGRQAVDTMTYHEGEIRRVAEVAFEAARGRRGVVTSVDKANVLECSRLWRQVVSEVGADFPDVQLRHQLVDSTALGLVMHPGDYDVLLTENMFGDILSDLLGGVVGNFGALPSASLGEGTPGLYEPVHGSAPDIAGQDRANPAGAILSLAMLCRYSLGAGDVADLIQEAVEETLAREPGIGTRAFGEAVARRFRAYSQGAQMA
jgi:3-isopropylmalate dehydrogenase